MTPPTPAGHRRPPLLIMVALAWVAAAALATGGTFAPLFSAHEQRTATAAGPADPGSGVSLELTAWHERLSNGSDPDIKSPQYGVPIVLGAATLLAGGLLGLGALAAGSGPAWRWSAGVAGAGAAVLLGAVTTVGMVVSSLGRQLQGNAPNLDAAAGAGLWLLAGAVVLGVAAVATGLIGRAYLGPDLLRPRPAEPDEPKTPPFGVPVIRPVGYDHEE